MRRRNKKKPVHPLADLWMHSNAVYVWGGSAAGKTTAAKQFILKFFKNFKKRK